METAPLMKPVEVARVLRCTTKCLRDWRAAGRGPDYLKTGDGETARILYPREAVAAWIEKRTTPTTTPTTPTQSRSKTK